MLITWLAIAATSSGGRRTAPVSQPDGGLAIKQQTPSGGNADLRGQHAYDLAAESLDTRKEAAEALAARYRASREKLHEADGGASTDVVGS